MFEKVCKVKEVLLVLALSSCFVLASALPCFALGYQDIQMQNDLGNDVQIPEDMELVAVVNGNPYIMQKSNAYDLAVFEDYESISTVDENVKFWWCTNPSGNTNISNWYRTAEIPFNDSNALKLNAANAYNFYGATVDFTFTFEQAWNGREWTNTQVDGVVSGDTVSDLLGTSTGVIVENAQTALAAVLPAALGIVALLISLFAGVRFFRRAAR